MKLPLTDDDLVKKYEKILDSAYRGTTRWEDMLKQYVKKHMPNTHDMQLFSNWSQRYFRKQFEKSPTAFYSVEEILESDIEDMKRYLDEEFMKDNGEWARSGTMPYRIIDVKAPFRVFKEILNSYHDYLLRIKPVEDAIDNANVASGINTDF